MENTKVAENAQEENELSMPMNNKNDIKTRDLTDKDFYEQACSYFYYHAEQRTTMINYFIAVFAAGLALYGSMLEKYPFASIFVSIFMFVVSLLFHLIDLRNRFDVKQSQCVIAQIEHDYSVDTLRTNDDKYVYGVFSNEDNTFKHYGFSKRRKNKEYKKVREKYRLWQEDYFNETLKDEYYKERDKFLGEVKKVSYEELEASFDAKPVITLSWSIKALYYVCMFISIVTFVIALVVIKG